MSKVYLGTYFKTMSLDLCKYWKKYLNYLQNYLLHVIVLIICEKMKKIEFTFINEMKELWKVEN